MKATRRELYDLANNYYLMAEISLLESDISFKVYEINYKAFCYLICICDRNHNYKGDAHLFIFRNKSKKFALNLCWKKLIEPSLAN
ncbi:hypothetical protein [Leeuwenhoekiella sp. NPDC079379]|uniref:hypothetical protein n=1 Tax=Leeuwenhoekiella sp. NPDC079379 TaxID=3364122 RepID=UPI0037C66B8A